MNFFFFSREPDKKRNSKKEIWKFLRIFIMDHSKSKRMTTVLECAICLETYTKPKVLPCGHTFCLNCLQDISHDVAKITCPECMKQHNIPDGGINQFTDNYVVISMIDASASYAPKSLCEACGENRSKEFCDHCRMVICGNCCALHKSSMSEIKSQIDMMHEMFYSPASVDEININSLKWQASLDNIVQQRSLMEDYFTKCIEVLESRRKVHNEYFDTLDKIHNICLRCTDLQASKLLGDKMCGVLMRAGTTCTNTRKLEDIKAYVSELFLLSQLIVAMDFDDKFTFASDIATITQLSSFGDVKFGEIQLDICVKSCCHVMNEVSMPQTCAGPSRQVPRDNPRTDGQRTVAGDQSLHEENHRTGDASATRANEPETRYPQVNYRDKCFRTTVIPAAGDASADSCLRYPTGATYCSHTNTLLVADFVKRRVMRYDLDGSNGRPFVEQGDNTFGQYRPYDVATSQSGRVFVTDHVEQRVLVFTFYGEFVSSFGSRGPHDGQFSEVYGITCHKGRVLVCDWGNHRVNVFTESGMFISRIETERFNPAYVAVGPDDNIYVTNYDDTRSRSHSNVRVYSWDGSLVREFGDCEGYGSEPGGVTVDRQGYVCVSWCNHNRVDVFNPKGELHFTFGRDGSRPGELSWPLGLVLLPDDRIVVCDYTNNRLQIF